MPRSRHHFVTAAALKRAALAADVPESSAMRFTLGLPISTEERNRLEPALRHAGLDIDSLPGRQPSPLAGRILTTTARSTNE